MSDGKMSELRLYAFVVIRNKTCSESAACRSLLTQADHDFRVLIYDNSDSDFGIRRQCEENGWVYLGGNGNRGLPVAYNSALDLLEADRAEGILCILDDDTCLKRSFISEMKSAAENSNADIILPVLVQDGRMLSPWREKGRTHFNSFEECAAEPEKNLLAFNSGMTVRLDVFRNYRYDEKLFLDCVDMSFLAEMKKRGRKIAAVPVYCEQSFSGMEKPPKEAAMKRFAIFSKDMRAFYGKKNTKCRYLLLKRAVHLTFIYGSLKPFAILSVRNNE
ncbi:MAG: glycosyltransferase [Oscillospiraceae bacterium]|nr:glycosyltransferase [Oscillospiraceae bacterium]